MSEKRNSIIEFGQELINARNYKGITLAQIAETTKIATRYLEAMEKGEWDALPRPYMEAFLKSYAEAVGMNVPKVLKQYREMVLQELTSKEDEEERKELEKSEEKAIKFEHDFLKEIQAVIMKKIGIIIAAALLVLIAILIIIFSSGKSPKEIDVEPKMSGETEQRTPRGIESQDQSTEPKPASAIASDIITTSPRTADSEIKLTGRAIERCWLKAFIDHAKTRDVFLAPEDTIILQAVEEIHLVVGNAGGLELSLKGESLGNLGPLDKPVTLVIGREGIKSQKLGAWHLNYESEIASEEIKQ